jgi:hypothetical protein
MVMMGKTVQSSFRTACRSRCSSSCSDDGFTVFMLGDSEGECLDDKVNPDRRNGLNADSGAALGAALSAALTS